MAFSLHILGHKTAVSSERLQIFGSLSKAVANYILRLSKNMLDVFANMTSANCIQQYSENMPDRI